MKILKFNISSIYIYILKWLFIGVTSAVVCYALLSYASDYFVQKVYTETDYIRVKSKDYTDSLQAYVTDAKLKSTDVDALKEWTEGQDDFALVLYNKGHIIYDSNNLSSTTTAYDSVYKYSTIHFADKDLEIGWFGKFWYVGYDYALYASMGISIILFFVIVMCGIRKKIKYLKLLNDEVNLLEGGDLDYEITVKGEDELANLADSLNLMRVELKNQIQKEEEVLASNQRLVTEMSHDLRTPMTAIMLYTEILRTKKYKSEEQMLEYIERIHQKASQMKTLTDNLFEYSILNDRSKVQSVEVISFCEAFYDALSQMYGYLMEHGFTVLIDENWSNEKICVIPEYVLRIIDNLTSNIEKYADPNSDVIIHFWQAKNHVGVSFENKIKVFGDSQKGTNIGVKNIEKMMGSMNGFLRVSETGNVYTSALVFPINHV